MKLKCIVVDDEPLALRQIAGYVRQIPFLELVAECRSVYEAIEAINNNTVELIFTDINMPDVSGLEFVKSLTIKPFIVFTTAYSEYAVEGFQVDATDYLLKPITFTNFLKAANKVKNLFDLTNALPTDSIKTPVNHLFVKSEYRLVRIELDEIKYVESQHEYVKIYLIGGQSVLTMMSLKDMEEQLPEERFMRVHRSFIVQLNKITVIERNRIIFDGKTYIPVSDQYKDKFQKYLDGEFV
jgi:DNA-binding LytR/AlgR family response regulator